ncbi:MAG: LysM peptidoglycan-binding domain-containing protein, partial [Proteobacteria bacterium]|nr:LysM peptidoglycan-binding domain-containing protein [Pseudomonadota bacterium]
MNKPIRFCFLILFCTFFVGCVSFQNDPAISVKEESSRLTNEFYEKALYAERQKDLVTAKKYYQLAITADPLNKKAQNGLAQTNKHLQSLSDKHYLNSIELYRKGKYSDAKRYLLMALRFWPENVAARQALTASQNLTVKKYVWHTIKKGETLSKISKTFYDNPHQSGIIAQINNIKDAANIQVGMKIKIPELKDHPFINQVSTDIQDHWADESIEPEQKLDPVMMYKTLGIEFYKDLQFDSAVVEFKKVLSADPSDTESMDYISKAYLEMGSIAHTQKKFLTAIEHFQN